LTRAGEIPDAKTEQNMNTPLENLIRIVVRVLAFLVVAASLASHSPAAKAQGSYQEAWGSDGYLYSSYDGFITRQSLGIYRTADPNNPYNANAWLQYTVGSSLPPTEVIYFQDGGGAWQVFANLNGSYVQGRYCYSFAHPLSCNDPYSLWMYLTADNLTYEWKTLAQWQAQAAAQTAYAPITSITFGDDTSPSTGPGLREPNAAVAAQLTQVNQLLYGW
jgi:hypothetical protein